MNDKNFPDSGRSYGIPNEENWKRFFEDAPRVKKPETPVASPKSASIDVRGFEMGLPLTESDMRYTMILTRSEVDSVVRMVGEL